jgi:NADPH2:quinone reductase
MYAAWYERNGSADDVLTVGEMDDPQVGSGEVRVRVYASGVNPSDVKRRGGSPSKMAFPRVVPQSDGAGIIDAVGEGVPGERLGERVWLWNAQFGRPFGTAAQYVALPSEQAVHLPDNVDFAAGACLGIPALTAHYGLFADGPISGQTVLISGGSGAVGNAAVQLAKWGGATVITTVSSSNKAEVARDAGADHVLNYKEEDVQARIKDSTGGKGVDRIVEVAFGPNLSLDLTVLKQSGVLVTYGSDAEREPRIPFGTLLSNDITVRFILVYLLKGQLRRQGIEDVNASLTAGKLKPLVAQHYPLEQIKAAHKAVESGQVVGNVVVDIQ